MSETVFKTGGRWSGARARKWILRAGFAVILCCLSFSTFYAYRLQTSLTEQTHGIYQRHIYQDNLLYQIRRTIWLGSMAGRDYMVDPSPEARSRFAAETAQLRRESESHVTDLATSGSVTDVIPRLRESLSDFWDMIGTIPNATRDRTPSERYKFLQEEIVPRRNAAGQVVREFAEIGQDWLKESELEFERTRRSFARRLLLILGLAIAFSAITSVIAIVHAETLERRTAEQYAEVERARAELQNLSARLLEIQEQERTRLSRELHDEIGQMIATLRLEVARSESLPVSKFAEIRERISRARQLAEKALETVRNICLMLRPTLLDDLGLEPALEWQAEEFTRRTGIACRLATEGLTEDLPDTVRTCVYRILQESLHNCEKHAQAAEVRVNIAQKADSLWLYVEDNGCGFDPAATQPGAHFGIIGMRERAASLKGSFDIRSSKGAGTTVSVWLPLVRLAAAAGN